MTITYYDDVFQGTDEWLTLRCGVLTASKMKDILTPEFKIAKNDKTNALVYELAVQRITRYVEPTYINNDMIRGDEEEILAKAKYNEHYANVRNIGFITNNKWGFTIGYSPDGIIGDDGLIEIKSRKQSLQFKTIVDGIVPKEHMAQIQAGLLVTERKWCDYISYSNGMPMYTIRVVNNEEYQSAILEAADIFEKKVAEKIEQFNSRLKSGERLIPTDRIIREEMI